MIASVADGRNVMPMIPPDALHKRQEMWHRDWDSVSKYKKEPAAVIKDAVTSIVERCRQRIEAAKK
jgi:hypothetical protein